MPKFVVFPDGQIADGKEIIAVKKLKFDDGGICVRVQLSRDLGVVDIFCSDDDQQVRVLRDVTKAILNFDRPDTPTEELKH